MSNTVQTTGLEIAVIGMAGRFPGARDIDEFWRNLREGVESITFFSDDELQDAGVDASVIKHPRYIKARGVLRDADLFDAEFFGFNPREAELLDPQHRLFLECTWQALEDAGCNPHTYGGLIGVCAGASTNDYLQHNLRSNPELVAATGAFQTSLNNDKDALATRVSYKLGLEGPSFTVQTACSTSLVAVHLACQCLLAGESDAVLAGGVSITFPQIRGYLHSDGMILSRDGHCRAFDEKASGAVVGRGVGVVLLKRLEDALAEGDHIRAVIKGSAINNDGSTKVGFTAPAIEGQARVIRAAHLRSEVNPETITYIETHGTGTELGDPIEIAALTEAFGPGLKQASCAIGSVKTNIGHLDAAAGIASLIKTVLALEERELPPSLHFERPNPKLGLERGPFYVNTTSSEWDADQLPRRAGVSSFGMGGTNAHVVLEEAPPQGKSISNGPQLLVLSARTPESLDSATQNLAAYLERRPHTDLADVAYSLQVGRKGFACKKMLVCDNRAAAIVALQGSGSGLMTSHSRRAIGSLVFLFPGQGTQYCNMGKDLYQEQTLFRKQVEECCEILESSLGRNLKTILFPQGGDVERSQAELQQTGLAQPALFVIEYALAKLWMSWGIQPTAMMGHSIGEFVAACLAGVFGLEDALRIVASRARLMQDLPPGAMLAVALPAADVSTFLHSDLSLAADNGPTQCTVSGSSEGIKDLADRLSSAGEACRVLHTSHAFHSSMMDPILAEFATVVSRTRRHPPSIPFVSNVSGTWISAEEAMDPEYWARHLRNTVRCREGIKALLGDRECAFLEIGPGNSMSALVSQHAQEASVWLAVSSLCQAKENRSDSAKILETIGRLWLAGIEVDWERLHADSGPRRVPLPTYAFDRQRFWVEPRTKTDQADARFHQGSKRSDVRDWVYLPTWKSTPIPLPSLKGKRIRYLIFEDECGLASRVAGQLSAQGHDVVFVRVGEQFGQSDKSVFCIRRSVFDDYDQLVRKLGHIDKLPDRIAHMWGVTDLDGAPLAADLFAAAQNRGYFSLLYLTQALIKSGSTEPVRIHLITNHLHSVTGDERVRPEKVTVLGLCRVIAQEYTHITTQCVDIDLTAKDDERLSRHVVAELTCDSVGEVVAYRGRRRWLRCFERCSLGAALDGKTRVREHGVYLVTGGLGGVGSDLAAYLAKSAGVRLVLVSRTAMPAKPDWASYLETHKSDDPVSQRIKRVQALEAIASDVVVEQADVADINQMRRVVDLTLKRFGSIHGVIHAAGVVSGPSFGTIDKLGCEDCLAQFRPKVMGTLVLDELLKDQSLDFVLLTSSLAAILGGLRFGAYAASNLFLDEFAQQQHSIDQTHWISVNLDGWLRDHSTAGPSQIAMTPSEGIEAVGHVLSLGELPQAVLSVTDLEVRMAKAVLQDLQTASGTVATGGTTSRYPRPNLQTDFEPPQSATEIAIASIWEELLGVDQVGIRDNFFELGGHSLLATQMVNRLKELFDRPLSVATIFEHSTVYELCRMIEAKSEVGLDSLAERSHRGAQRQRALQQEMFAKRKKRKW